MFEKTKPFRVFFWLSLLLIGFFVFFPLLWMINSSLKPRSETFSNYFFVGPLTLDNVIHILTDSTIMTYLRNSLLVSFGSSILATIVTVIFTPAILVWMQTPENVLPYSITYFRIYFAGISMIILYNIERIFYHDAKSA